MQRKNKIQEQMLLHSFNSIQVKLQLVAHKNGSNYAYTNARPANTATVFGLTDVNCSFSVAKKGEKFSNNSSSTAYLWLWDCDEVEAGMYAQDFGTDALIIVNEEGNGELITYQQAESMLGEPAVPTSPDAEQPNA